MLAPPTRCAHYPSKSKIVFLFVFKSHLYHPLLIIFIFQSNSVLVHSLVWADINRSNWFKNSKSCDMIIMWQYWNMVYNIAYDRYHSSDINWVQTQHLIGWHRGVSPSWFACLWTVEVSEGSCMWMQMGGDRPQPLGRFWRKGEVPWTPAVGGDCSWSRI